MQIFEIFTAHRFSTPDSWTNAPVSAVASMRSGAVMSDSPVSRDEVRAHVFRVAGGRVDPRADRGRAHVDLPDQRLRFAQAFHVFENRVSERGELLAERHRHRVLQLCAPQLDVRRELLALLQECRRQIRTSPFAGTRSLPCSASLIAVG